MRYDIDLAIDDDAHGYPIPDNLLPVRELQLHCQKP
jgi:hypothetical protein